MMNRYKSLNNLLKFLNLPPSSQSASLPYLHYCSLANVIPIRFCSEIASSTQNQQISRINTEQNENQHSVSDYDEKSDVKGHDSAISHQFNFSMYANESPLIQKFIDLKVNLYEIQKRPEEAQYLVTLNLEKVKRYVLFLSENGVPEDKIGKVITKNPLLFKEDLDDLQVRINYLWSKKFDKEMISTIITRNPKWLSTPVRVIDERLGFLQQSFKLKGDEIREMIIKAPSVALVSKRQIFESIYTLKEEMGLDGYNLKRVVLSEPALLRKSSYDLILTFEYLTKTMNVSLDLILKQPKVLTYRKHLLQDRHKFLISLGRAQYCNLLPGYVNLADLVDTSDSEFCEKVAKTSVELFYEFLKTL